VGITALLALENVAAAFRPASLVFSASVCVEPAFRRAPGGTGTLACAHFAIAVIPRAASAKGFLWRSNKVTRGICFWFFRVPHTSFLRAGLAPVCVAPACPEFRRAFRCGFGAKVSAANVMVIRSFAALKKSIRSPANCSGIPGMRNPPDFRNRSRHL